MVSHGVSPNNANTWLNMHFCYAIVTNILDINGTCTIIQTVYIYFNIHVVMYLPDT